MDDDRILRIQEVLKLTGLCRTTLWRLVKDHKFPEPRKLGPRAIGWRSSEIHEWIRDLPGAGQKPAA